MCEKAKAAGAQVAPRKRRAVAQTVAAESSTGNDVDSTELLTQLENEKTNSAAILASKADLADRNDVLRGRVQCLEDQMSQLNVEMQKMRAEMVQLKPLVPLLQQINGILSAVGGDAVDEVAVCVANSFACVVWKFRAVEHEHAHISRLPHEMSDAERVAGDVAHKDDPWRSL